MNRRIAFTLIELLVVIAIIGILSGLIVVTMSGVTQKANIARGQVFSNSLRNALMMNLVSEWKFDDLSTAVQGSAFTDSWNGGNNMILSTGSDGLDKLKSGTDCVFGKCLSFDGSNDYAYVSGSDSVSSNLTITGPITLSAWVKFSILGTAGSIVTKGVLFLGNGNYGYSLEKGSDDKAYFQICNTTTRYYVSSLSAINTDWHNVVATWDGTAGTNGVKLYIDGVLNNQGSSTISLMGQPNYQFRIGMDGNGSSPLNGLIDEVRIYNAATSSFLIKEQYYSGLNSLLASGAIDNTKYSERISVLGYSR